MSGAVAMIGMVAEGTEAQIRRHQRGRRRQDGRRQDAPGRARHHGRCQRAAAHRDQRPAHGGAEQGVRLRRQRRDAAEPGHQGLRSAEQDPEHLHLFGHLRMGRREAEPVGRSAWCRRSRPRRRSTPSISRSTSPRRRSRCSISTPTSARTSSRASRPPSRGTKVQLVAAQSNANTDPTVDTQLTNLKASGADTLVVATAGKAAAQAIRFAAESGWKPTLFVTYAASSDHLAQGRGPGEFEGRAHRPVREAGRLAGVRQRSRREAVRRRLRAVQAALRPQRLARPDGLPDGGRHP